jgi:hypothetical protein
VIGNGVGLGELSGEAVIGGLVDELATRDGTPDAHPAGSSNRIAAMRRRRFIIDLPCR